MVKRVVAAILLALLIFAAREIVWWRPVLVANHPGAGELLLSPDDRHLISRTGKGESRLNQLKLTDLAARQSRVPGITGATFRGWSANGSLVAHRNVPLPMSGPGVYAIGAATTSAICGF